MICRLTLDLVDLDPLSNIHHLDVRSLFGAYRLVQFLLVADPGPIVGNGTFHVPALVLWFLSNLHMEPDDLGVDVFVEMSGDTDRACAQACTGAWAWARAWA